MHPCAARFAEWLGRSKARTEEVLTDEVNPRSQTENGHRSSILSSRCNLQTLTVRAHPLIHNYLALHPSMAKTAGMATLKRIGARCLSQELNRGRFSLLELPTVVRRSEN